MFELRAKRQAAANTRDHKPGMNILERRENPLMKKIKVFRNALAVAIGLPIHFEDEVLTTREADRDIGPDDFSDARAAAIILRTYLARRRNDKCA